jgi:predicted helicase
MPTSQERSTEKNLKTQIKTVMDKYNAPQEMTNLLVSGINQAMMDPNTEGPENIPAELASVASAQEKIEWKHILKGKISKAWITYLEQSIGNDAIRVNICATSIFE